MQERSLRDDRNATGGVVDEDGREVFLHPFAGLDRMAVLLECRVFHDANYVRMHPKRCCQLIAKLLWFVAQGESMGGPECCE